MLWWKRVILKSEPHLRNLFFCFNENTLKVIKNAFYLILKAAFVLKIFKLLSLLFGQIEKTAWLDFKFIISNFKFITSQPG